MENKEELKVESRNKSKGSIIFHSASLPQNIQDDIETLKENYSGERQFKPAVYLKNAKLAIWIMYYKEKPEQGKFEFKNRRILLGRKGVLDGSDGYDKVNPIIKKSMCTRMSQLIIGNPAFDKEAFVNEGSFFNKRFWKANLLWGNQDSIMDNFIKTVEFVRNHAHVIPSTITPPPPPPSTVNDSFALATLATEGNEHDDTHVQTHNHLS